MTNDLAAVHKMLIELSSDEGRGWCVHDRVPDWALARSTREVGTIVCGSHNVKLYVGPWIGLRVLGLWDGVWHSGRVLPRVRMPSRQGCGLAHRLTSPDYRGRR